ncbi:hypothetical protein EZI54_07105 [Marinobacter halodurans]|uniref:Uncharacterized protein n=1 Tax=Marinobacter halodurans TaxID=2528979 RepID=A0ABY1ZM71_9GAMM|nr:hypothetical protein [Marinobacter halodurans]TBW57419.1 hypothetical protein EZI54_07105 [Marinobacter halodurans]
MAKILSRPPISALHKAMLFLIVAGLALGVLDIQTGLRVSAHGTVEALTKTILQPDWFAGAMLLSVAGITAFIVVAKSVRRGIPVNSFVARRCPWLMAIAWWICAITFPVLVLGFILAANLIVNLVAVDLFNADTVAVPVSIFLTNEVPEQLQFGGVVLFTIVALSWMSGGDYMAVFSMDYPHTRIRLLDHGRTWKIHIHPAKSDEKLTLRGAAKAFEDGLLAVSKEGIAPGRIEMKSHLLGGNKLKAERLLKRVALRSGYELEIGGRLPTPWIRQIMLRILYPDAIQSHRAEFEREAILTRKF